MEQQPTNKISSRDVVETAIELSKNQNSIWDESNILKQKVKWQEMEIFFNEKKDNENNTSCK